MRADEEAFRLRRFVRLLEEHGELETACAAPGPARRPASNLTLPPDQAAGIARAIPEPPHLEPRPARPVAEALAEGPMTFGALMEAAGSRDGRDVLRALDGLGREGRVERLADGRYGLVGAGRGGG